jgi:hypothetical protein
MRRSKFVELVSTFLDGEISEKELLLLRKELAANPERRALLASYKRMNEAAAKASFPEMELEPVAGYRHSFAVSTLSWSVAGAFAGFLVVFVFIASTRNSVSVEDSLVAMDVARPVVVTNSEKPVTTKPRQAIPEVALTPRTPIHEIVAASLAGDAGERFSSAYVSPTLDDPLARVLGNANPVSQDYGFAGAAPFSKPNSSLIAPVSFVPMTDH